MVALIREFQTEHAELPARILSDAISRNTDGHARKLTEGSLGLPHHLILARIHADGDDRTVGAASILAKTERERRIAELKREIGIDFGSGYTSDPVTISTLPTFPKNAPFIRWSWKTNRA
jgi:ribonuclease HII